MTMNEQAKKDLSGYVKQTRWSALVLLSLLFIAIIIAWSVDNHLLLNAFIGAFLGTSLACANLFALGYAFFVIAIKKSNKWVVLWPLASFLLMCCVAFVLAVYVKVLIIGFALGLTAPVILGLIIVFLSTKPA